MEFVGFFRLQMFRILIQLNFFSNNTYYANKSFSVCLLFYAALISILERESNLSFSVSNSSPHFPLSLLFKTIQEKSNAKNVVDRLYAINEIPNISKTNEISSHSSLLI